MSPSYLPRCNKLQMSYNKPMENKLESFTSSVLRLAPQYINMFGTGMPGMAGASVGAMTGAFNPAADIVRKLQEQAVAFHSHYKDGAVSNEQLTIDAKDIEGSLLALQTVSEGRDDTINSLIDTLHNLLEERTV